ncbi:MAG: efflux RND transporter periplasmic adaptor subunit [Deltaproteobacteria bacterium]|nr:efflux RND transporter periplasmic adaptor subunit [Deltaproteobacteria bacterium]
MKPPKAVLPVLLILILAGVGAGVYFKFYAGPPASRDAVLLFGNVDIREVRLAFQANGRIAEIRVQEGDQVKAGQLVAVLDPVRYQAALAQSEAAVAGQEQVLARLLAGSRPEEIARARAQLAEAQANLRDVEKYFQRRQTLVQTKAISQQDFDNTKARYLAAKARVDAADQTLTLAIKGPRQEDIDAARAQLAAAEAAQRLAARELADTELYAPSDGVIQDRIMEPGDMASPQSPALTLALTNPVWVRAFVEEPDLGRVAPGMRAEILTDSFPDHPYRAWVGYISPSAEFTPKQVETRELRTKLVYRVRIHACNPQGQLRLGMPVTVRIPLDQPGNGGAAGATPCPES